MRATFFLTFLFPIVCNAAVIFSSCPVSPTDTTTSSTPVDRFRPQDWRLSVRSYSHEFPLVARYIQWVFSDGKKPPSELNLDDAEMKHAGWVWEDLQFITALSNQEATCHSAKRPTTKPYAIFPFVFKAKDAEGKPAVKVRYKVCEYYVDDKRQIPFDDECNIIGRETGYTFKELEERYAVLQEHVERGRSSLKFFSYGLGAVASLTSFRFLRFLKLGTIPALGVAAVPAAVGSLAVEQKWVDEFARNMIDFKDAAEVAVYGDLTTSVAVAMPMEDFLPFFFRYLDSLGQ